jgi:hypothetical protein
MTPAMAKALRIAAGIVAANVFGAVMIFLFMLGVGFAARNDLAWLFSFATMPSMLILPMSMGVIAAYFWRATEMRIPEYLLWWIVACLVIPAGGYVYLHEGVVCLLIGWPIVFVGGLAGVMLGRLWFKHSKTVLNLTVFPLLVLAMFAEARVHRERTAMVTDRLVIRAPTAQVWRHVVAFPPIEKPPDYWLNAVGLPSPIATTCAGPFVGADRRCIFSGGLVFKEQIARLDPERRLTFDIIDPPADPELLGHLTLHRGEFELQNNGDGTTTLTGRSWYTLHMRPLWYFDCWARDITRHVHRRVMEHIRQLSEEAL